MSTIGYIAGGIIILGATIGALAVIWRKVVLPGAQFISTLNELLPLLQEFTEEFKGTPHAFEVLDQIVEQFRSDSGSTLKDQVNRLEAMADRQEMAAQRQEVSTKELQVAVASAEQRAKDEREQTQRLVIALDRLTVKLDELTKRVDKGAATSLRIEKAASDVADDLAASHKRADAHDSEEAGGAADAAAQMTVKEKRSEGT